MNVLAVDQGTSATKALVVSESGEVLGVGRAPVHPRSSGGGAVEQDPQELLESIVAAGRDALREAGAEVGAVGLANQGETVLRWDRAGGRPLGPALGWQDRRAAEITSDLADHAERLTEITGLPLDPYFAAPKMAWLRRQAGDAGVVTMIDAWLTHQLTGSFVTDAASASRTLLLDLASGDWSPEACQLFTVEPDEQPEVVDCAAPIGETTVFGSSLPVTGLVVDQQAALFAESCFTPGDAKCTYGTGAFILATLGDDAIRSRSRLAVSVAWRLDRTMTYCLDGQIYTAGAAISWLQRLGLIQQAEDLDRLEPGTDAGPIFVPSLAGLGAPFWAPNAQAGWTGLSLATTRDDLVRAVVWGVATQIACLARAVEEDLGRPLDRLRVDGGLSGSTILMQAQADLLQMPIERYPSPDATAHGVAAFARLGAGIAKSPADAVGTWQPTAVFEPHMSPDEAAERLSRFNAAARALTELSETKVDDG